MKIVNNMDKSKYIKLTHREHILKRPDTYVGSCTSEYNEMYVVNNNNLSDIKIVKKKVKYNQAFIKIFDEILTNASDASIRNGKVKNIKVIIDDKKIIIENDGPTVPLEFNKEHNTYLPQMLWMDLLTGENYNDNEDRELAGKNGYGSKLTNIYSSKFKVECCDGKKMYKQWSKKNMSIIDKPIITDTNNTPFTRITYYPDYSLFDINEITDDLRSIMYKRCLDVAVYIPKVRIKINKKLVNIKKISDYMKMHLPDKAEFFFDKLSNGWEIGIAKSNEPSFAFNSICNGVTNYRGGTHLNYISLKLSKKISENLKKKITWQSVKNKLYLFVVCKIINPSFDTQTKEFLTNRITTDIHKNFEFSDTFIRKIMKSEIVKSILDEQELKEKLQLKKMSGSKKRSIVLPKLHDANKAGGRESYKCTLFLAEGDSALSSVIAGMSVVGRDYYGAFPLKGKILNVRDASTQKIKNNKEIQNLLKIIGLEFGKKYTDLSELRYGKIVIFTDADLDGIHIKGLLLNFFEDNWIELVKMGFLFEFITPILKAKKGKQIISFYTQKDYNNWKSKNLKGWSIKYYKGLGTSTPKESKEYFKDIDNHLLPFNWDTIKNHEYIDMVFNNKRSDERKTWMLKTIPKEVEKYKTPTPISSFINNEMILYSLSDNIRSIPDIYDGLKPSQRKILYTVFKKNITTDYAVSALGGLVKSLTKYHHAETSLEQSIINLAQNYVGSNNLSLLVPEGQFGTRLEGGKDASSSRYLNTYMSNISRIIFDKNDDSILEYLVEDGHEIEPKRYKPIIPMVLINGADGIGTGWSTNIPNYNPKNIIQYIENKLNGKTNRKKLLPYYNNFKGSFEEFDKGFISRGIYKIIDSKTIEILELPIGMWNTKFKDNLFKLIESKIIKSFTDHSTDIEIKFIIKINLEYSNKFTKSEIIKTFKLESKIYTSNMYLFNDGKITKYNSPESIINDFYNKRLKDYDIRKKDMVTKLSNDILVISNQVKFILSVIKKELIISNRKKDQIIKDLTKLKFDDINGDQFNYLLSMSIFSLSKEKVLYLRNKLSDMKKELKQIKSTSVEEMWLNDLSNLKREL